MDELKTLFDHIAGKTPDFTRLEIENDDLRLCVERERQTAVYAAPPPVQYAPQAAPVPEAAPSVREVPEGEVCVKSPIVGTFYASPNPESPPYVSEGQRVSKGQVLCIVEAMKMMNEIESETDGVITGVLSANGELVEYGQPLFRIREGK